MYFSTSTIYGWQHIIKEKCLEQLLINTWSFLSNEGGIKIYAFVIMSNHIHWIFQIIEDEKSVKDVTHSFLSFTSKQILKSLNQMERDVFKVDKVDRKYQIWKSPSLNVKIISPKFLKQKMAYIHLNPFRAEIEEEYHISSFKSYELGRPLYDFLTLI